MPVYNEDAPCREKIHHVKDRNLTEKYGVYGCRKKNKRNKKKKADFRSISQTS